VRDLFYGANTFWQRTKRARLSLLEEQSINETAQCKIIGLTLETRPDTIDADELRRLRRYGCTRLQLGVQHTDDGVLKKINRGCTTAQVNVAGGEARGAGSRPMMKVAWVHAVAAGRATCRRWCFEEDQPRVHHGTGGRGKRGGWGNGGRVGGRGRGIRKGSRAGV
jgi:hypothetical protein